MKLFKREMREREREREIPLPDFRSNEVCEREREVRSEGKKGRENAECPVGLVGTVEAAPWMFP